MDLRIDMVGTSCENNAAVAGLLHPLRVSFAFFLHVLAGICHLLPAGVAGRADLRFRNVGKTFTSSSARIFSLVKARNGFMKRMDGSSAHPRCS